MVHGDVTAPSIGRAVRGKSRGGRYRSRFALFFPLLSTHVHACCLVVVVVLVGRWALGRYEWESAPSPRIPRQPWLDLVAPCMLLRTLGCPRSPVDCLPWLPMKLEPASCFLNCRLRCLRGGTPSPLVGGAACARAPLYSRLTQ